VSIGSVTVPIWRRPSAVAIACWAVLGVLALLVRALLRLLPLALEPLVHRDLNAAQAALYAGWALVNAYAEGYRGFQKRFSPRVVMRARAVAEKPKFWRVVFAPAFCMSLFGASRRGVVVAWSVTATIVSLVLLMPHVAQPWRGIVDGGVVVGLGWGVLSLLYAFARLLAGRPLEVPADLPTAR
jgi:hypothetical protein